MQSGGKKVAAVLWITARLRWRFEETSLTYAKHPELRSHRLRRSNWPYQRKQSIGLACCPLKCSTWNILQHRSRFRHWLRRKLDAFLLSFFDLFDQVLETFGMDRERIIANLIEMLLKIIYGTLD